ncbi:MAG: hypothetical protein KJ626_02665 [Verrucomicrobia bacterium]|nr:hypothetical protein [Verrucomicrobiota bacterium]
MKRDYEKFAGHGTAYDLFFPDRLTRLEYFTRTLIMNFIGWLCCLPLKGLYPGTELPPGETLSFLMLLYAVVVVIASGWIGIKGLIIPRLRDAGMSTRLWWLILVPLANIYLGLLLLITASETKAGRPA